MIARPSEQRTLVVPTSATLSMRDAAPVADAAARATALEQYQRSLAPETLRRHKADLALFAAYLAEAHIRTGDLPGDIWAWEGVSIGLVTGFREWQLARGYAIGSVGVRLATVKKYARVAWEAGVLSEQAYHLICTVKSYYGKTARNIDEKRDIHRRGAKKEHATAVSVDHMQALAKLLSHDETPVGRRDYALVCLLGYQGLRCSEVADLRVDHISLPARQFVCYRRKTDKWQRHRMHPQTLLALSRYLKETGRTDGLLFAGMDKQVWSSRDGTRHQSHLVEDGLARRSINARIGLLGHQVGLSRLSPHDLRHYWTFDGFQQGTPLDVMMQAGGWSDYRMPLLHYRRDTEIANEGIRQSD